MDIKYNPDCMHHKDKKIKIVLVNILTDIADVIKTLKENYNIPINEMVLIDDRYVAGATVKSTLLKKYIEKGLIIKNSLEYSRMINNPIYDNRDIVNRYPVIANVNRISEENFEHIVKMHGTSESIYTVLDSMVNSLEHDNYQSEFHMRYTLDLTRGAYYECIDKDVMYLVNKLRIKKNKVLSTESLMVQYRNISFAKSKFINAPDINSDHTTVVPTVHYNTVASAMFTGSGRYELDLMPGDRLNLLAPRVLTSGCKEFIAPSGSCIEVIGLTGKNMSVYPYVFTAKCKVTTPESHAYGSVELGVVELPIDMSAYARFFDSSYFNISDNNIFNIPECVDSVSINNRAVAVSPYNILTPWMTKYRFSKNTTVYIQDAVASMNIMSEESYFNNMAHISEKVSIVSSFRFEPSVTYR